MIFIVKRDPVRKRRAEIGDTKFSTRNSENSQVCVTRFVSPETGLRRFLEQARDVNLNITRRTRPEPMTMASAPGELFQNFHGDGTRLIPITGIERRLAATDDVFWNGDFVTEPF